MIDDGDDLYLFWAGISAFAMQFFVWSVSAAVEPFKFASDLSEDDKIVANPSFPPVSRQEAESDLSSGTQVVENKDI